MTPSEKYPPQSWDELKGCKEIKKYMDDKEDIYEIRNLIFRGNPGLGKTQTASIVAQQLLKEKLSENYLVYTNINNRNVDEKIKELESKCTTLSFGLSANYLVLIDEVDNLTIDNQKKFTRLLDKFNGSKFIFTCNNIELNIALLSRCKVFTFTQPKITETKEAVLEVAKKLNKELSDETALDIAKKYFYDIRQAIDAVADCA